MADRPHVPYNTPPSSPYRHPPSRNPRSRKTSSSSGPRVSSQKKGDPPRGSRVVNRPSPNPSPQRSEPMNFQPLRSVAHIKAPSQKPKASQTTVLVKDPSSKGVASKANLSRNAATNRKASEMSPPKKPSSGKAVSSEAAPVI
ncbi:uncharacterized protein DKFZp434B061-like [Papaver somniferum]|uniref:uncharacterized protein DKFZp434B061-like n=1 Tax=Papaver somniferum TaxID=3469 RepID=UPI000E6F5AF0|nr:uncharacterized protein DKFZp434B061-like [Papaver somniferum]